MTPRLLLLSAALAASTLTSLPAHAIGRLADVTVIDRDSGATLPVYYSRGDYWVAGRPGARYAVTVRNKLGERVLAVPSVDGVNVLSGETAGWDQSGYVFSPYEKYQITGWRKSSSEVAAFEFSAAGDSYAGLTGRPGSIGVIGVALFREQLPEPVAQVSPPVSPVLPWYSRRRDEVANEAPPQRQRSAPPAPAAPSAQAEKAAPSSSFADRSGAEASGRAQEALITAPSPTAKLGTAHGQRETSVVSSTRFVRLQPQPNEIIRIRYDSRENLVASGVIREPQARTPSPNPFPDAGTASYVPDPPVRRY